MTGYGYTDATHPEDVTSVTDPEGNEWSFGYNAATGQRTSQEDPLGNTATTVFNDAGWVTSSVSPRGNAPGGVPADHTTSFTHDIAGRTLSVTDPEGSVVERHLNAAGQVEWQDDASDNRTSFTYDVAGRPDVTTRADLTTERTEFWPDGQLKTRFDAANAATGYTYDAAGRRATSTDPLNRVTTYGYDLEGRKTWTQDHGGNCAATRRWAARRCRMTPRTR